MESKKSHLLDKLSFGSLIFSLFLSLFFFIPCFPVSLEASKGFLIFICASLSLFFWLIARLVDGKFQFPQDRLILFGAIIPVAFLISSLFSSSLYISLFGSGFELGTFGSMLSLYIIFFLSSIYFQNEKRLWYFIGSILIGAFVLAIFEIFNISLGVIGYSNSSLSNIFKGITSGNLFGDLNNFGLFFGLILLISLFTLEFLKLKKIYKIFLYIILSLSVIFLIFINIPLVWLIIGIFSIILFVCSISFQNSNNHIEEEVEEQKIKKFPYLSLIIVLLSLIFLVGNNLTNKLVSKIIYIENSDIRPSLVSTTKIAYKSFLSNPVLGTGPNTFSIDWARWHPKEVTETIYWNSNFSNGFSLFSTFAVTTGVLGFISILWFMIVYFIRGIQSIKVALKNPLSNYFIIITFIISLYCWLLFVIYNPNIVLITIAFMSSGILIGILVKNKAIKNKTFHFLNDPRNSFFSILGIMIFTIGSISVTYIYLQKFVSIIYFSNSLNSTNTTESLNNSELMLNNAISLDKNDSYYRNLSQVYLAKINLLVNDENISQDVAKTGLQNLINLAQSSASMAVSQNPKYYLNYLNLGNIYATLLPLNVENSYESANNSYSKALELSPYNPSIILAKAYLEISNKNNDGARELIKEALAIKKNYTDAIFLLSQIEVNEGNLNEAIKQAEYAAEVSPYDSTIFFRLGLLRYNNMDYTGAVSAFEQAVILNQNYLNARYFLALSYQKIGRGSDALTQFKILSQVLPENEELKKAAAGNISIPEEKPLDEEESSSSDNLNKVDTKSND